MVYVYRVSTRTYRVFLAAVAVASLACAVTDVLVEMPPTWTTATQCPPNESKNPKTGVCIPKPPTGVGQMTTPAFGGPPEVDGVPCTGHNSYECIGLAEEGAAEGPTPTPHSTFTSSP